MWNQPPEKKKEKKEKGAFLAPGQQV